MKKGYKECPYCANEIKEKAIKCQYCGEFLDQNICVKHDNKNSQKWLLISDKRQLESCIETGKTRKSWGWSSIVLLILIVIVTISSVFLSGKEVRVANRLVGMMLLAFIWTAIYFLVWLIKNYRILLNSKTEGLTCKSSFLLLIFWICPVINLFKPQKIMEDLLKIFLNNVGEIYDNKLIKKRGIFWIIALISLGLTFCYPTRLSEMAIITYIISHSVHMYYLINIIDRILVAQEKYLKDIN